MTMNFDSSFQSSDNMRQQLNITVPQDQIQAVFEKNYLRLQKTVKLSGFRQGKVPLNIIRKNYKSQVAEEALSEIINQSFKQALEKHKVVPVSSPRSTATLSLKKERIFNSRSILKFGLILMYSLKS